MKEPPERRADTTQETGRTPRAPAPGELPLWEEFKFGRMELRLWRRLGITAWLWSTDSKRL